MRTDVIDEILEARGRGRDLLRAADGYSYYRLPKSNDRDIDLLAKRLWMQRWRRANPDKARERDRRKYRKQKSDPAMRKKLKERYTRANRKRQQDPKRHARANVLGRKYYHQARSNPEKAARIRERNRATYGRIKIDQERLTRRKTMAAIARRRRAAKAK